MGNQYFAAPLQQFHVAAGTAYANSTTLTDVSPAPQKTMPGLTLQPGTVIDLRAAGSFSTTATPTLLLGFYYGGVAGVALAASSAITTGTTAAAWPFLLEYRGQVRSVGTGGQIVGQGRLYLGTSLTAFTVRPIPETAAARTVSIDTTTSKAITVGAQWGAASASNTLTVDDLNVVVLN